MVTEKYEQTEGNKEEEIEEWCPPSPQSHIDISEEVPKKKIRRSKRRKTLPRYIVYKELSEREETKLTTRQLMMVMRKKGIITEGIKELDKETKSIFPGVIPERKHSTQITDTEIIDQSEITEITKEPVKIRIRIEEVKDISKQLVCSNLEGIITEENQKELLKRDIKKKNKKITVKIRINSESTLQSHSPCTHFLQTPSKHKNTPEKEVIPKYFKENICVSNTLKDSFLFKMPFLQKSILSSSDNILSSLMYSDLLESIRSEISQHTCPVRTLLSSISKKLVSVINNPRENIHMQNEEAFRRVCLSFKNIIQNRKECCTHNK